MQLLIECGLARGIYSLATEDTLKIFNESFYLKMQEGSLITAYINEEVGVRRIWTYCKVMSDGVHSRRLNIS